VEDDRSGGELALLRDAVGDQPVGSKDLIGIGRNVGR
jgi:hypothetical protein